MRRVGCILLAALVGLVAVLVGAQYLPDAPRGNALAVASKATGQKSLTGPTEIVLMVPIAGVARASLEDSWGDPRDNGKRAHHGTDIMAPLTTPIIAVAPGTVEKLWTSVKGGTTLYLRSPARRWTYYYAHLSGYAPGLHEGQAVAAGDLVGYVGVTGDAEGGSPHLHFGLTRTTPDQHWYQGTDVDPYPYLAGRPLPG